MKIRITKSEDGQCYLIIRDEFSSELDSILSVAKKMRILHLKFQLDYSEILNFHRLVIPLCKKAEASVDKYKKNDRLDVDSDT